MRRQQMISIVVAGLCASVLFYALIQPNVLNVIPYLIHKEFFARHDSTGESLAIIKEQTFIKIFDAIISIIFFGIVYKFLSWRLTKGMSRGNKMQ